MRNILVLTDFSNTAYGALFYITRILNHQEARFLILNAYTENTPLQSPFVGGLSAKPLLRQLEDEAEEGLRRTVHRIRLDQENPKHEFTTLALQETVPEAVIHVLKKDPFDLIVMGNKGTSAVKNIFFGSNVIKLLNAIERHSILAVPEETTEAKPFEIAFAADYNHAHGKEALTPLLELATLCSAAIRIVHINEEEQLTREQLANLKALKALLGNTAHTLHWLPEFRTKTEAIHTFITELGIGMLAMVKYRHGFLDSLLREPVIKKVSFTIEVPFLILPDPE